jgi:molecular chaperone GrpE
MTTDKSRDSDNDMPPPTPTDAPSEQPVDDAAALLAAVQTERNDLEQKLLRTAADYQNYVRRSEQHRRQACEQQLLDLGRAMVTVLDHFDHATAVDAEKASVQAVLDGVQIVRDELMRTLERFGIRRVDAVRGEPFNPDVHEALMRQQDDEVEPGHVVAQLQAGYMLNDMTLRPAKVTLAAEAEHQTKHP